jgi:hypothetical protein
MATAAIGAGAGGAIGRTRRRRKTPAAFEGIGRHETFQLVSFTMRAIHLVVTAEDKGLEFLIAFLASVLIYRHNSKLPFSAFQ